MGVPRGGGGGAEAELESFLFFVFTVLIKFYLLFNNYM